MQAIEAMGDIGILGAIGSMGVIVAMGAIKVLGILRGCRAIGDTEVLWVYGVQGAPWGGGGL